MSMPRQRESLLVYEEYVEDGKMIIQEALGEGGMDF